MDFDWLKFDVLKYVVAYAKQTLVQARFENVKPQLEFYAEIFEDIIDNRLDNFNLIQAQSMLMEINTLLNRDGMFEDFYGNRASDNLLLGDALGRSAYDGELANAVKQCMFEQWFQMFLKEDRKTADLVQRQLKDELEYVEQYRMQIINGYRMEPQDTIAKLGDALRHLDAEMDAVAQLIRKDGVSGDLDNALATIRNLALLLPIARPASREFSNSVSAAVKNAHVLLDTVNALNNSFVLPAEKFHQLFHRGQVSWEYLENNQHDLLEYSNRVSANSRTFNRMLEEIRVPADEYEEWMTYYFSLFPQFKKLEPFVRDVQGAVHELAKTIRNSLDLQNENFAKMVSVLTGIDSVNKWQERILKSASMEVHEWINARALRGQETFLQMGYAVKKASQFYGLSDIEFIEPHGLGNLTASLFSGDRSYGDGFPTIASYSSIEYAELLYGPQLLEATENLYQHYEKLFDRTSATVSFKLEPNALKELSNNRFLRIDFSRLIKAFSANSKRDIRVTELQFKQVRYVDSKCPAVAIGLTHAQENYFDGEQQRYRFNQNFENFNVEIIDYPGPSALESVNNMTATNYPNQMKSQISPGMTWNSIYYPSKRVFHNYTKQESGDIILKALRKPYRNVNIKYYPSYLGDWLFRLDGWCDTLPELKELEIEMTVNFYTTYRRTLQVEAVDADGKRIMAPLSVGTDKGYGEMIRFYNGAEEVNISAAPEFSNLRFIGWNKDSVDSPIIRFLRSVSMRDSQHLIAQYE